MQNNISIISYLASFVKIKEVEFPQKSVEFYKKICYNTSRKLYREDF